MEMANKCCVNGCKNLRSADSGVSYHRFPNDENLRKRWMEALRITAVTKSMRVCSEHFSEDSLNEVTAELTNGMCDVTNDTDNVHSTGALTSRETEPFADTVMILNSVISFLHELCLLTNKSLVQQELTKRLPTVAECDLQCYTTCIWFTAHCLTSKNTTSLPDVTAFTTIDEAFEHDSGFFTPIVVEPSREFQLSSSAVVETVASTTCSAVASCTETFAGSLPFTNSEAIGARDDDVEQSDAVVPTGHDCVELVTCIKTERDDDPVVDRETAPGLSVCGVNPDIILNTGDLPVAVTSTEAVTPAAAAAGETVESGRSEFECNRIKYKLKECHVLLRRLDQHSSGISGNASVVENNITSDSELTRTEAESDQNSVQGIVEQPCSSPFHDERVILTEDYLAERQRSECFRLTRTKLFSKTFNCSICGAPFESYQLLQRHKLIHTGEKKHKCNVCGVRFLRPQHLRAHEQIHTAERPFKCKVCGSSFVRPSDVRRHEQRVHSVKIKRHMCNICGIPFLRPDYLRAHEQIHAGEELFKCEVCGTFFSSSNHLREHEKAKHSDGGNSLVSNDCGGVSFPSQNTVCDDGIVIQSGDASFKCEVCDATFERSDDLQMHEVIHTEARPFKCNVCGYSCRRGSDLRRHILLHSGEKPYKCQTCGLAFQQRYYLHRHEFTHSKPFVCRTCGSAFIRGDRLREHIRRYHGELSLTSVSEINSTTVRVDGPGEVVNTSNQDQENDCHRLPSSEDVEPKVEEPDSEQMRIIGTVVCQVRRD